LECSSPFQTLGGRTPINWTIQLLYFVWFSTEPENG